MSRFSKTPQDAKEFKEKSWFGRIFLLGTNFMAGPLVLGAVGRWIDKKTGHEMRYLIIGVILGLIWATYEAFKIAWYINRESGPSKKKDGPQN